MQRYSMARLAWRALRGNRGWRPAWRECSPRSTYDVVIVGGGGHGLATAYYLASKYGVHNVAVLERGWIGGGNSGRNTQVVRSNYFHAPSSSFYDHSLRLYEGLASELNFNVMLSQRGLLELAHSEHELEMSRRWCNAVRINGIDDVEMLRARDIKRLAPPLELNGRFPVLGGFMQRRAGICRHDAVVWGFARGASALGVDIVQDCEVTGFDISGGRVLGVRTARGVIGADRVVMNVAGYASQLAALAGLRLPITTMALQAMVTEPLKPVLDVVVTSATVHAYVSQSDRGEIVIGAGADAYNSYAQRGGLPQQRATIRAVVELFPSFSRLKLMRQWAGRVDITPDTSPIMGETPIQGLFINCGWGTGGFKAIPAGGDTMAHTVATGQAHPLITCFGMDRFRTGRLVDEGAAAGVAH